MSLGEGYELRHIRLYGFHPALHCGYGVALTAKADTASHDGSKLAESNIRCAAAMHACEVASKDKYLIGLQFRDIVRRIVRTLYSNVRSQRNAICDNYD